MHFRQNIVTRTSVSTLVYAVLLASCSEYGSDADGAVVPPNTDLTDQVTDGTVEGAGDTTSNESNANEPGSDGTTQADSAGTSAGNATEGAPDVDRAPTTEPVVEGGGDGMPEAEGTPEGEGEAMPDGEGMPDGEVTPEEPVVMPTIPKPCDIYAAAGTPCVGAYSMVRVLTNDYEGPLYQVRRGAPNAFQNTGSGGQTQDIGFNADGFADAAAQDAFCGNQNCTVSRLYDQSPERNDLTVAPGGCYGGGDGAALENDFESDAKRQPLAVGGRSVYGLYMNPHEGYRNNQATGTAEGQEAQGVYMVADGRHAGAACCWDFGTASRDVCYGPTGIMSALMFGWGYWGTGAGNGPWMMGDFELGVWTGGSFDTFGLDDRPAPDPAITVNPANPSLAMPYAFGALSTRVGNYSLRMGDARGGNLVTAWDGPTQITWNLGGAIILGIGGDNSNWSFGTFFEGAVTAGAPSRDADEAVYRSVQEAGYGR